jgi:hypothetical protein
VIEYGDEHLRTGAFQLSISQFWMIDIFLVLSGGALALLVLLLLQTDITG